MSSAALSNELGASGVFVITRTVRKRLTEVGLKDKIPRKKSFAE